MKDYSLLLNLLLPYSDLISECLTYLNSKQLTEMKSLGKEWKKIVELPICWKTSQLIITGEKQFNKVAHLYPYVGKLVIFSSYKYQKEDYNLNNKFKCLHTLEFNHFTGKLFPCTTILSLILNRSFYDDSNELYINQIIKCYPKLVSLVICTSFQVVVSFSSITSLVSSLICLEITLTEISDLYPITELINLQKLSLLLRKAYKELKDKEHTSIKEIFPAYKLIHLKSLELWYGTIYLGPGFIHTPTSSLQLEELKLSNIHELKLKDLSFFKEKAFSNIKKLSLWNKTFLESESSLLFPHLQMLEFSGCQFYRYVTEFLMSNKASLKCLRLSPTLFFQHMRGTTYSGMDGKELIEEIRQICLKNKIEFMR